MSNSWLQRVPTFGPVPEQIDGEVPQPLRKQLPQNLRQSTGPLSQQSIDLRIHPNLATQANSASSSNPNPHNTAGPDTNKGVQTKSTKPVKDKLPRATLEQKVRVLDWYHQNSSKSQRSTVKYFESLNEFSITKTSFNVWVKDENEIRAKYAASSSFDKGKIKTMVKNKYPLADDALYKFYEQALYEHGSDFEKAGITGNELISKWFYFAYLIYPDNDFKDVQKRNGWLQHFKLKNREKSELILKFNQQESDIFTGCVQDEKKRLKELISHYRPSDVFHFDEFAVTSKLVPSDYKHQKFVLGLGMNSNNTEFLPLLKISSVHMFKDDPYYFQSNTNMITNEIFYKYLEKIDQKLSLGSKDSTRKILLLVDKLYEHVVPQFKHIDVQFFNSNNQTYLSNLDAYHPLMNNLKKLADTEIQPLNLGIIKNFKIEFKVLLMKHHLNYIETNNSRELKPMNIELIYDLICDTFKSIQDHDMNKYLLKCWEISGILPWNDNKKSTLDQFNQVFRRETEYNFWKLVRLLQHKVNINFIDEHRGVSLFTLDHILYPMDEYVMNRHYTDEEIVSLVKLQSKPREIQPDTRLNQQVNSEISRETLSDANKVLNIDVSRFLAKNIAYFPESNKAFQTFMNSFIKESMDIYLSDYKNNDKDAVEEHHTFGLG